MLLFQYTTLCFTDFVPDPETRYQMGNVALGIFFFNLLMGLLFILRENYLEAKESCIERKDKCRVWCVNKGCMKPKKVKSSQKY
jgi:hypothetical protein